jgi:hypothetical protein
MSPVTRAACMLAAGAALGLCAVPSFAKAEPVIDAAVAQLADLNKQQRQRGTAGAHGRKQVELEDRLPMVVVA